MRKSCRLAVVLLGISWFPTQTQVAPPFMIHSGPKFYLEAVVPVCTILLQIVTNTACSSKVFNLAVTFAEPNEGSLKSKIMFCILVVKLWTSCISCSQLRSVHLKLAPWSFVYFQLSLHFQA